MYCDALTILYCHPPPATMWSCPRSDHLSTPDAQSDNSAWGIGRSTLYLFSTLSIGLGWVFKLPTPWTPRISRGVPGLQKNVVIKGESRGSLNPHSSVSLS